MLDTYMTEIVAAVAILILAIVYFSVIKPKQKQNLEDKPEDSIADTQEDTTSAKTVTEDTASTKIEKKIETAEQDVLSGEEEGDFGVYEASITLDEEENVEVPTIERNKRTVPPHGKIHKENFKDFAGQRILVAEDNLINQKVISGLLADTGIEITMADDGQEALDILANDNNYNIILMDAHMPRVDGFEATREIRKIPEYNHIVVVALSGDTASDDIKKMRDAGMEEQLEKPLRMDSLYDILYAYFNDGSSNDDEDAQSFITKELNTEEGLSVSGYDEEFYDEILNEFVNTYSTSTTKLRELLKDGKLKETDKYLLDLSGITANIGAANISKITIEFKKAISHPEDKEYVQIFKDYTASLQELLKDIKQYKSE